MRLAVKILFFGLTLGLLPLFIVSADQSCSETIIPSTPEKNFMINGDGTVTSKVTGLMWMRCSLGQEWNGKTCKGTAAAYSWQPALKEASGYQFAGYDDWRLPNKNELESIIEVRCSSPAINSSLFPGTPAAFFWTSSPYAGVSDGAWSVDFAYGTVNASVKTGKILLRLVRSSE